MEAMAPIDHPFRSLRCQRAAVLSHGLARAGAIEILGELLEIDARQEGALRDLLVLMAAQDVDGEAAPTPEPDLRHSKGAIDVELAHAA